MRYYCKDLTLVLVYIFLNNNRIFKNSFKNSTSFFVCLLLFHSIFFSLFSFYRWQVADDPETLRIKQNTKIISNVAYHGDLEKKAAMEKQRGAAEASDTIKGGY